jgi:hypothetical protein
LQEGLGGETPFRWKKKSYLTTSKRVCILT